MGSQKLFLSYSHSDMEWKTRICKFLSPALVGASFELWDDSRIDPGSQWKKEIEAAMELADLAILLVSPEFLASRFVVEEELPRILSAAQARNCQVFWIPLSHSNVKHTKIHDFQAAWNPKRPLKALKEIEQDEALELITDKLLEALKKSPQSSAPPEIVEVKSPIATSIEVPAPRTAGQAVVAKLVGSLELHVNVGGEVQLEGEEFSREFRLKKSELWIQDSLPVGDYRIRARQEGYEPCEQEVEIVRDKRTTLNLILDKILAAGTRRLVQIEGVEFAFCRCPPGSFLMGSPEEEEYRSEDERQHEVRLTRGYWLQETAVTQRQWEALMGNNPSQIKGADRPVENVSWEDAAAYCERLKAKTGFDYRLPTEAEWEYGCRAGTTTPFHYGSRLDATMANFFGKYPYGGAPEGEFRMQTTAVRSFAPNAWGLYDMHGNVWEWCEDWYGEYPQESIENPIGPAQGTDRVLRGGSWFNHGRICRSAYRGRYAPGDRDRNIGFRLATSSSGK